MQWLSQVLSINIIDIAIITIKKFNYCWIIHNISKSGAINFFKHSVFEKCENI